MSNSELSRRGVLKLGTAASVAALAGCGGSSSDTTDDIPGISDTVPAGADLLLQVDIGTVLGEEVVRDQFDAALSDLDSGFDPQPTVSSLLTSFEEAFGLDPGEITELLAYIDLERGESAAILAAEWSEDEIQTAIEADEQPYNGQSIYQSGETTVGVLPDGRYVASTPPVTRKVIDVATGDRDRITGDIVSAFSSTSDGYVRFAFTPPASFSPGTQGPFDFSTYGEVSYGHGTFFRDGATLNSELVLEATSSDAATDTKDLTNRVLEVGERQVSNDEGSFPEDFGTVLDSTEASQSGTTVRVENDDDRGYALIIPLAVMSSFVLGFGDEPSDPPPQISLESDYDPEESSVTLRVAAISGNVTAGNLIVRGDTPDSDKRWHELQDVGANRPGTSVLAGDSATVRDVSDGDRVVLEYDDESTSFVVWSQEF